MLKLYCVLPCEGQEKKWSADKMKLYRSIQKQVDDIHCAVHFCFDGAALEQSGAVDKVGFL